MDLGQEQRSDALLRDLVVQCQAILEPYGFRVASRGGSAEHNWVRLSRRARDPDGHTGMLQVLVAHAYPQHAVLVDVYFVDAALDIQTPRRKLLRRYEPEAELSRVVREVADAVRTWPGGAAPQRPATPSP